MAPVRSLPVVHRLPREKHAKSHPNTAKQAPRDFFIKLLGSTEVDMNLLPMLLPTSPRCSVSVAALGCLVWSILVPSAPARAQDNVFGETIEVRVVNLEVVVTDKKGERIHGLGAEDFELLLDGEPIDIDYFSEIDEGVMKQGAEGEVAAPGLAAGEQVPTSYLLFIDEYFSITRDRDRVLDRLIAQVRTMAPQDRMAVVRYDGVGLERLSGWTAGDALVDALQRAKQQKSQGLRRLMEQRPVFSPSQLDEFERGLAGAENRLTLEERYYVERLEEQLQRVVRAGVSTMRSFAAPPGRKVMLLLSGGWPFDPVEYVVGDLQRALYESTKNRFGEVYTPLRDTANLLGYSLYPVDVPGFQSNVIDAETRAFETTNNSIAGRTFFREEGNHRTLLALAEGTGGRAILNSNRDRALETVVEDTRSYYWLGFQTERAGDDQRHRVEVRVKRPGLRVRTREDYFDFSRQSEVTLVVESALYFGTPPSELPLDVKLTRPKRAGLRSMKTTMEVLIPVDELTLLPGAEGWVGQVELRVAVLDRNGATTDTPVLPLTLRLADKPEGGTRLAYSTELKLRRIPQTLVVAVYDVPSGGILSSSLEVAP